MGKLIGRSAQQAEIQRVYNSNKAELLAVYGRRRVGKTFLIDETLKGKITFRHAGLSPVDGNRNNMKEQLKHFFLSLKTFGYKGKAVPHSWLEAFFMLEQLLQEKDDNSRQVVFLDELPWMDTPRSGFITAFEGFWNTWGCHRDNFMLVVCGSANSWILDNLLNSHGGLYGRVTYEIKLSPFNLAECKEYYEAHNICMSNYDIVQSYMILGGIPYYLGYLRKELSLAQNVDRLFWGNGARLRDEFDRLFDSAFDTPDVIKEIVCFLAGRHSGFTRQEIIKHLALPDGGLLSKRLKALVASDFIIEYIPFGKGKKDVHYKLTDSFCLFYLHFVKNRSMLSNDFWTGNVQSQNVASWRGLAFEGVCFNHIKQIKTALGISGISSEQSAWAISGEDGGKGCQIDMLISRKDNVVNMCEMKFYNDEFVVDKDYDMTIRHRINVLSEHLPRRSSIHPTIITTFGVKKGLYSDIFIHQLTIDNLF